MAAQDIAVQFFLYSFSMNPSATKRSTIELSAKVSKGTPFLSVNSRIVETAACSTRGIRSKYVVESAYWPSTNLGSVARVYLVITFRALFLSRLSAATPSVYPRTNPSTVFDDRR